MPANPIELNTSKHFAPFITFSWGAGPTIARFVRFDYDVAGEGVHAGLIWLAAPELDVTCQSQHGGAKDAPHTITLRRDRPPLSTLCRPYAHAPISATIAEGDPYDFLNTYRVKWAGRVHTSARNQFGLQKLVKLEVVGRKHRLPVHIGTFCLGHCDLEFGDGICQYNLASITQTGPCTVVNNYNITVTGLTVPSAQYFQFGEAKYDGLSISILNQVSSTEFALAKRPPPEWAGKTITMVPGCDKELEGDCRNTWNNEHRFRAMGIVMPKHHPQYEAS